MENQIAELKNEIEFLKEEQKDAFALIAAQSFLLNTIATATLDAEKRRLVSETLYQVSDNPDAFFGQDKCPAAVRVHLKSFAELLAKSAGEQSPE